MDVTDTDYKYQRYTRIAKSFLCINNNEGFYRLLLHLYSMDESLRKYYPLFYSQVLSEVFIFNFAGTLQDFIRFRNSIEKSSLSRQNMK